MEAPKKLLMKEPCKAVPWIVCDGMCETDVTGAEQGPGLCAPLAQTLFVAFPTQLQHETLISWIAAVPPHIFITVNKYSYSS